MTKLIKTIIEKNKAAESSKFNKYFKEKMPQDAPTQYILKQRVKPLMKQGLTASKAVKLYLEPFTLNDWKEANEKKKSEILKILNQ